MNKAFTMLGSMLILVSAHAMAQQSQAPDTTEVRNLQSAEIVAGRANKYTPIAVSNIGKADIARQNTGRDLPYILSLTPSVTTTSDAGMGIGYTTLRIRGIDPSRINITLNGIPLNEGESHQVFWVNISDLASSLEDIQIQRGVGSSTNGAGAFGASVNMVSERASLQPRVTFDGSYGTWNSHKETLKASTGLIDDHWTFDVRLSDIGTNGYVHHSDVSLQSFFTQTGFFNNNTALKLLLFGGKEKTNHAWNYATREEIAQYGRRYNSCGLYWDEQGEHYYDDQTDNYAQTHAYLILNQRLNRQWKLNAALHATKGDGYYEEYKSARTLKEYGLQPWFDANGDIQKKADLVRRKHMDTWFYGQTFNADYTAGPLHLTIGQAFNRYDGDHFGQVIWVKDYTATLRPNHEYYFNRAHKNDFNVYVKGDYQMGSGWSVYADLQYRHVLYRINGNNDNWDWINGHMQRLAFNDHFNFLNPKAGLNYQINDHHRLFASYSLAQKEPYRNCYTDGHLDENGQLINLPKAEKLHDYELGYQYGDHKFSAQANLFYMNYRDQLVMTGELNEIGEPLTTNIDRSYRLGVETQLAYRPNKHFRWDFNATWSRNINRNFTEYLTDDDTYQVTSNALGSRRISFSPDWIVGNQFTYNYKDLEASLQTKYVSKQYMSNAELEAHALDAYCVSNLSLRYRFHPSWMKRVTVGCTVYNIFNETYENNGYAGSGMASGVRYEYAGYSVQAPIHIMGHLSFEF